MTDNISYWHPQERGTTEFIEKKSRFIANISPASTRLEAMSFIEEISSKYHGTNHNCTAFIIGAPTSPKDIHCSDDGEPSGTAGKPMLNVLVHNNLGDIVVVVSRFFGGIKLGTGGLVRAYSQAVKDAVAAIHLEKFTVKTSLNIRFQYQYEGAVRRVINKIDGAILNNAYGEAVTFSVEIGKEAEPGFVNELQNLTNGSVLFLE